MFSLDTEIVSSMSLSVLLVFACSLLRLLSRVLVEICFSTLCWTEIDSPSFRTDDFDRSLFLSIDSRYSWSVLNFFKLALYLFLMSLSIRPGMYFWICTHLLPYCSCSAISWRSSATVHFSLLRLGSTLLYHLSLHCLPIRPGKYSAISFHFLRPCSSTFYLRISSSFSVQFPLISILSLSSSSSS